MDILKL